MKKSKSNKNINIYEVRWHGRGRILMSRSYCRDRVSVQKYINDIKEKCLRLNAYNVQMKGSTPDYFETIDKSDFDSGISIRKINKPLIPYNMIVNKFDDLYLLYSSSFKTMLNDNDLKSFCEQEKLDIESHNKLYSNL